MGLLRGLAILVFDQTWRALAVCLLDYPVAQLLDARLLVGLRLIDHVRRVDCGWQAQPLICFFLFIAEIGCRFGAFNGVIHKCHILIFGFHMCCAFVISFM